MKIRNIFSAFFARNRRNTTYQNHLLASATAVNTCVCYHKVYKPKLALKKASPTYLQAADWYESRLLCFLSPLRQTMPFKPQTCHSAFYFASRGNTVNSWQLLRCVTTGCDNPPPDTKTHRTPPKNVFIYFSSSSSTHLNRQLEHCQANPFFAMFLNSRKTNARIPLNTGQRAE